MILGGVAPGSFWKEIETPTLDCVALELCDRAGGAGCPGDVMVMKWSQAPDLLN